MFWIGLTGGLASGKSTVAEILRNKKIPIINADSLAREAVRPGSEGLKKIVTLFGTELLVPDGTLDRKKLASKVFGQKTSLDQLENILHPIIRQMAIEAREKLKSEGHAIAFYDVPLLFEKNMQKLFDRTVLVATSVENQIQRAVSRDKMSEEEALSRMSHQIPLVQKLKLADYIIDNNSGLKELEKKVDQMLLTITNPKNIQRLK